MISLATQSSITPGRLAILFIVCFSATYLAALVPIPNNIFAAQHLQYDFQQQQLLRRPASVPLEVLQQYQPHGPSARQMGRAKVVLDMNPRETAFYAAGGGQAGAHTWAELGDEVKAKATETATEVTTTVAGLASRLLRIFGVEGHKRLLACGVFFSASIVHFPHAFLRSTPPVAGGLPKSDVGKDLPHPSWGPSKQAPTIVYGVSDDGEPEVVAITDDGVAPSDVYIISPRVNGQAQKVLPLPFQKTDHSPPSRFIEHREPAPGSSASKKHAIAHGLFPEEEVEHNHAHDSKAAPIGSTADFPKPASNGRMQIVRKKPSAIKAELKDDEASPEDHLAAQAAANKAGKTAQASAEAKAKEGKAEEDKITREELSWGAWMYD